MKIFNKLNKSDDVPTVIRAPILLLSTMIFQGMLYMDPTERRFKLGLTAIFSGITWWISRWPLFHSLIVGHLTNFFLNGHLWGLAKKFDVITTSDREFERWTNLMRGLGDSNPAIAAVIVYGSFTRGDFSQHSDLDVRVIRYEGIANGLIASVLISLTRARAFVEIFPLDIYLFDGQQSLDKLRDDENPVVLVDKEGWFNNFE